MNCKFCGKQMKPNGKSHQLFCKLNPDKKDKSGENNPMFGKKGSNQFTKAKEKGLIYQVSEETCKKISERLKGIPLSESTKKKISESMKIAHEKGIAWNIGKSRWNNKKSYPEIFFATVIDNEFIDKNYKTEFPVGIYSIDFARVDKKLAIEIDGDQHERFQEIIDRDNRKDLFLEKNDRKVLRIKRKDMFNNTKQYIKIAYEFIHN